MDWHGIHIHYHDVERLNELVLDAVRPLLAELAGTVTDAHYLRHWRQGTHLRLAMRCDAETFVGAVLPAAARVLDPYLANHPSRSVEQPEASHPTHQRLAALEHEPGPLLPWRSDNSWFVTAPDRRLEVLGSEAAADLLARFLAASTELAFDMAQWMRAGGQPLRLGFDLMVAVAHGLSGDGIRRGFLSYRSHSEAFLCAWPEGHGQREDWDRWYAAHADQLVKRVRSVVSTLDGTGGSVPFVEAWVRLLEPFLRRGRELIGAGEISLDHRPPGWDPRRLGISATAEVSPFHQRLASNQRFLREVVGSPGFATWRLILNYQYLHLTRLGINPVQRALLGHLVSQAVEDEYGVSGIRMAAGAPA